MRAHSAAPLRLVAILWNVAWAVVLAVLAAPGVADDTPDHELRLWKDASGSFQVRAKLIERTDGAVRLRKTDGKEISVPLAKLSQADQEYVDKTTAPKPVVVVPEREPRGLRRGDPSKSAGASKPLPDTGRSINPGIDPVTGDFEPDPLNFVAVAELGSVPVCDTDAYDAVSAPKPADAACSKVLVSVGRHVITQPNDAKGRIYLVDWKQRRADPVWEVGKKLELLDHDPDSGRSVFTEGMDGLGRGGEIVVAEGLATGEGKILFRRTLPGAGNPGFQPHVEWACMVSASHLLAIVDLNLFLWDLPAARLLYRVEGMKSGNTPAVSPNGASFALSCEGGIAVIETATGKVQRRLSQPGWAPTAAFDPTGRHLAICTSNRFCIWDCQTDTITADAVTTEHLGSGPPHWIGPRTILSSNGNAIDTELGMAVWKYALPQEKNSLVAASRLWFSGNHSTCSVTAVEVPHRPVGYVVGAILAGGEAALVMAPGMAVSIAVDNRLGPAVPIDEAAIRQGIAQACQQAGWGVQAQAPVQLLARLERLPAQELKFRDARNGNGVTTATMQPFKADLEIRRGNELLWSRGTQNYPPTLLFLGEGETVQQAVTKWERPHQDFFTSLHLPPRIPRHDGPTKPGYSLFRSGTWEDVSLPASKPAPAAGQPPIAPPRR